MAQTRDRSKMGPPDYRGNPPESESMPSVRLYSQRLLALFGLICVVTSMMAGFHYASRVSHVANAEIKLHWETAVVAAGEGNIDGVRDAFHVITDRAEKRGRFMNAHSHLGAGGVLLLLVAALNPIIGLKPGAQQWIAVGLLAGALAQYVGVMGAYLAVPGFLYLAHAGAVTILVAVVAVLFSLLRQREGGAVSSLPRLLNSQRQSSASRLLIRAGLLLLVVCMLTGTYLAWQILSGSDSTISNYLRQSVHEVTRDNIGAAQIAVSSFKAAQTKSAINAAAHSHGVQMAMVMLLLALLRPIISLSERALLCWCIPFVVVSYAFPLWIFLAANVTLSFARFANYSGLLLAVLLLLIVATLVRRDGTLNRGI